MISNKFKENYLVTYGSTCVLSCRPYYIFGDISGFCTDSELCPMPGSFFIGIFFVCRKVVDEIMHKCPYFRLEYEEIKNEIQ